MRRRLLIAGLLVLAAAGVALFLAPEEAPPVRAGRGPAATTTVTTTATAPRLGVSEATSRSTAPAELVPPRDGAARIGGTVTLDAAPLAGVTVRWRSLDREPDVTTRTDARGAFLVEVPARPWTAWEVEVEQSVAANPAILGAWAGQRSHAVWGLRLFVWFLGAEDEPAAWSARAELGEQRSDAGLRVHELEGARLDIRLQRQRRVTGRVVDDETGQGLPGATVGVASNALPDDVTRAAPDGAFELDVGPWAWSEAMDDAHHVTASASGYAPATIPVPDVEAGREVVLRLRWPLRLEGRVVDELGAPLAARVVVSSALVAQRGPERWSGRPRDGLQAGWSAEVACDADGRFALEVPPGATNGAVTGPCAAAVHVEATVAGRTPSRREHLVHAGQPPLVITILRSASLRGVVLDPAGVPRAGATVLPIDPWSAGFLRSRFSYDARGRRRSSEREEVVTDAGGRFALDQVPTRRLLLVEAADLAPRLLEVFLPLDQDLVVRLAPSAGEIEGVLLFDGEPAAGRLIEAYGHGRPQNPDTLTVPLTLEEPGQVRDVDLLDAGGVVDAALTDAHGRFRLTALLPGRYDLGHADTDEAHQEGVAPGTRGVRFAHEWRRALVELRPRAAEDGASLGAGRFEWLDPGEGGPWWFPREGRVSLPWSPRLGRRLALVAPGRRPVVVELDLEPGAPRDLGEVRFERGGGRIELDVAWPPSPGARVRFAWHDPASGSRHTWSPEPPRAPRARFEIDPVGAGAVELHVLVDDDVVRRVVVDVRDGEATVVDVDLR